MTDRWVYVVGNLWHEAVPRITAELMVRENEQYIYVHQNSMPNGNPKPREWCFDTLEAAHAEARRRAALERKKVLRTLKALEGIISGKAPVKPTIAYGMPTDKRRAFSEATGIGKRRTKDAQPDRAP